MLNRIKGEFSVAEPLFYQSLKILHEIYGEKHTAVAEVLDNLGFLLLFQGKHEEAVAIYNRELAIRNETDGENHPVTAHVIAHLANCVGIMGDYADSEKFYRRARKIILESHPNTHPVAIEVSAGLASTLLRTNQKEAEHLLFEILETKKRVFGRENPQYAWTLYNLAYLMNNQRRFDEAQKFANEILAFRKEFINDENPVISAGLQMSAIALMGKRKAERAEPLLRESLALRERTLSQDHWLPDTSKSILGECLAQIGKIEETKTLLVQAYNNLLEKLGSDYEQTQNARARIEKLNKK